MKSDVAVMIFYKASGFGCSELSSNDLSGLQYELKKIILLVPEIQVGPNLEEY